MRQWELRGVTTDRGGPPDATVATAVRLHVWDADQAIRTLVDQLPAVFWTTDAGLIFTSFVGAGLAGVGLGPNQVVGMTVGEVFEGGPETQPLAAHRDALEGRSVRFDMAWSGTPYSCGAAPLRDTAGESIGVICVAIDATPLVHAAGHTVVMRAPVPIPVPVRD